MFKYIVSVLTFFMLSTAFIVQLSEPPFQYLEQMPQFKGGQDDLYQFVATGLLFYS